ncbi:hypothetical protein ACO3VM_02080 [Methanocaldococcus sp. 10A]
MFKGYKFDEEEFKKLAEWLFLNNSQIKNSFNIEEGIYRSIIGRYYYYIFLKIRNIILSYDDDNVNSFNKGDAHRLITLYLKALDEILELNGDLEDIADSLSQLRDLRNKADYETYKKITWNDVLRAKGWVEDIELSLQNIKFRDIKGFENILEHIKVNCKISNTIRFPKLKKDINKNRYYFE